VQHEGICIAAEFGNNERHPLSHQARDERNIPGKPIQLRNDDAAPCLPGRSQGRGKLRAPIERVSALPGLELGIFGGDQQRLGNWRIRGANGAAALLDIKPTTLESRLKKLGLTQKR
jgi:hypothetical protein